MTSISLNKTTFYQNQGNSVVLDFLSENDRQILDIGCGAGDTGALIRSHFSQASVTGITCSESEYEVAKSKLNHCMCLDIERDSLDLLPHKSFDAICFIHVLEHLVDPVEAIKRLLPYLKTGGKVTIALPNIANWRYRWKIAMGKFEYTEGGVMDKTHLHFYTFNTAVQYLIDPVQELNLVHHYANGNVPLGVFRHHFLNFSQRKYVDRLGSTWIPNLFGYEIVLQAIKSI
jgi:trans-aconitate methyltransferase